MELNCILAEVVGIHNELAQIYVNADNAIHMSEAIKRSRTLAAYLQSLMEGDSQEEQDGGGL